VRLALFLAGVGLGLGGRFGSNSFSLFARVFLAHFERAKRLIEPRCRQGRAATSLRRAIFAAFSASCFLRSRASARIAGSSRNFLRKLA
jgi:hypothetical protein